VASRWLAHGPPRRSHVPGGLRRGHPDAAARPDPRTRSRARRCRGLRTRRRHRMARPTAAMVVVRHLGQVLHDRGEDLCRSGGRQPRPVSGSEASQLHRPTRGAPRLWPDARQLGRHCCLLPGITTMAILQSLSQARDRWGDHAASAIWDASIVKIILGGASASKDLQELSLLIGERDELADAVTIGEYGSRSLQRSARRVAVLPPERIRTLPFGTGLVLLRSAPQLFTAGPIVQVQAAHRLRRSIPATKTRPPTFEESLNRACWASGAPGTNCPAHTSHAFGGAHRHNGRHSPLGPRSGTKEKVEGRVTQE
jgi:hypothetical protein